MNLIDKLLNKHVSKKFSDDSSNETEVKSFIQQCEEKIESLLKQVSLTKKEMSTLKDRKFKVYLGKVRLFSDSDSIIQKETSWLRTERDSYAPGHNRSRTVVCYQVRFKNNSTYFDVWGGKARNYLYVKELDLFIPEKMRDDSDLLEEMNNKLSSYALEIDELRKRINFQKYQNG